MDWPNPPRFRFIAIVRTVLVGKRFFGKMSSNRRRLASNRRRLGSNRRRLGYCLHVPVYWAGNWKVRFFVIKKMTFSNNYGLI